MAGRPPWGIGKSVSLACPTPLGQTIPIVSESAVSSFGRWPVASPIKAYRLAWPTTNLGSSWPWLVLLSPSSRETGHPLGRQMLRSAIQPVGPTGGNLSSSSEISISTTAHFFPSRLEGSSMTFFLFSSATLEGFVGI